MRISAPRSLRRLAALGLAAAPVAALSLLAGRARLAPADFTFVNEGEVQTLDPAAVTGIPEGRVVQSLFEGLVVKDPRTLEPRPGMAESWEVSEDGLLYTFHLRRGARWSNGEEVDAESFLFSFERFLNPETAAKYAYLLWCVRGARDYTNDVDPEGRPRRSLAAVGIRAPDRHTLSIELERPTPYFLDLLGFYPLLPVHRKSLEEARRRWPHTWRQRWLAPENLVTNGPFRIALRRVNDRIRLVKNETYWDADNVAFDTIDVLAVEQDSTALNLYLTGAAQWITRVSTKVVPELLPREDFDPTPYLGSYFYRVNVTRPPLDDPRLRRALWLAIPRETICERILKMGQLPTAGLVPPGVGAYRGAPAAGGSLAEARALLAQAGFGPEGEAPPTIEIHYNTSQAHQQIALVIAEAWRRELGIETKLANQEFRVYLDTQRSLDYDVSRSIWIGDYVDPATFLEIFVGGGENNRTGWAHAEYDRLMEAATVEVDPARRLELLRAAESILTRELPILPIYSYVSQNLVDPRLGGFHPNVLDEHPPKFWYWMDDEELAAKRAAYPRDDRHRPVVSHGPRGGQYAPSRRRAGGGR